MLATLDCHLECGATRTVGLVRLGAGGEEVECHRHRALGRNDDEGHL